MQSGEDLELRPPWRFPSLVSLQVGPGRQVCMKVKTKDVLGCAGGEKFTNIRYARSLSLLVTWNFIIFLLGSVGSSSDLVVGNSSQTGGHCIFFIFILNMFYTFLYLYLSVHFYLYLHFDLYL